MGDPTARPLRSVWQFTISDYPSSYQLESTNVSAVCRIVKMDEKGGGWDVNLIRIRSAAFVSTEDESRVREFLSMVFQPGGMRRNDGVLQRSYDITADGTETVRRGDTPIIKLAIVLVWVREWFPLIGDEMLLAMTKAASRQSVGGEEEESNDPLPSAPLEPPPASSMYDRNLFK